MKKRIAYLGLVLASITIVSCSKEATIKDNIAERFISIPDAGFEKRLIELGIDTDGVINQKMFRLQAEAVENLEITQENIFDLTGIESFIGLKTLTVSTNKLTSIDLTNCTLLENLTVYDNFIKSLDFSTNTKLVKVNLTRNNLNSILGLEKATNLKELHLSHNLIEKIDVSNSNLEKLYLGNNLLTEVSLDTPNLETLELSTNNLVSLNIDYLENLKTIEAANNKLINVDICKNLKLETLIISQNLISNLVLGGNQNLLVLNMAKNSLSELDITGLIKLEYLDVKENSNLSCIKISTGQIVPTVKLSNYQDLKVDCN